MAKKIVMVFGVFDVLHPGHIHFLEKAKACGDILIVAVTPDKKVFTEKSSKTVFNERERMLMVSHLRLVDKTILGDKKATWHRIEQFKPDIICLGHDQRADYPQFLTQLKNISKKIRLVRIKAKNRSRYASSKSLLPE